MNQINDFLYEQESYLIRGACFKVWKQFGGAFKESVIEKSLIIALLHSGLTVKSQEKIPIYYENEKVGIYIPDLIINGKILIELKCVPMVTKQHLRQFWYYLRGSQYKLGFLINFGSNKLEIRRRVYDIARQRSVNQRINQR